MLQTCRLNWFRALAAGRRRWDFGAKRVPVPGAGQRAYPEITPRPGGCHLELHQFVRSETEAQYMERAWGVMLARFRDRICAAVPLVVDESSQPELL